MHESVTNWCWGLLDVMRISKEGRQEHTCTKALWVSVVPY
jgi:hypothetical protein